MAASGSAAATGLLIRFPLAQACAQPVSCGLIPADKAVTPRQLREMRQRGERRIYKGEDRFSLGMPVGGICAGQVYVLGDGTLGGWHIDGRRNPTGYGRTNYQTKRAEQNLVQGFMLDVRAKDGRSWRAVLADVEFGGDYDEIEFIGEYPIAEIRYKASEARSKDLPPVDVVMHAYSPFVPLNAAESSLPCTVVRFELTNRTDENLDYTLTGWLENGVQRDAIGKPGAPEYKNESYAHKGITSIVMSAIEPRGPALGRPVRRDRMLADFNGPDYAGWTVEGEAFGKGPAKGTLEHQNLVSGFEGAGLVNTFIDGDTPVGKLISKPFTIDRNYLIFLIGGGGHEGQTCMNLLVDGQVVRTSTGKNNERLELDLWDLTELEGRQATLEIVDAASGGWGHINVDRISLADEVPPDMRRPRPDDLTTGTMALAFLGEAVCTIDWGGLHDHPRQLASPDRTQDGEAVTETPRMGAIAARHVLKRREKVDLPFAITWHFPNIHTQQKNNYTTRFDNALDVVKYLSKHEERLYAQTNLFRRTYYEETTLPWWLALRLMMPTANLATGTAQWWDDGRFWGWEGVGCCSGTCTHVWNYAHAHARLFPELARSTRVMQDLGTGFDPETGRVAFRGLVDGGHAYAADGQAGTVLKSYREHLCSADDSFLRENWPRIKKVLEFQIGKDAELSDSGEPDGIIHTSQHNTYDINFHGPNTMVGSLYLASLLAGAAMADRMSDPDAARYRELASQGRSWTEANLFNGEFFEQRTPENETYDYQYGPGCLADQLFGQSWSRLLDLGTVYDEKIVTTTLGSIYRYNFAPAVGQYNTKHAPERVFARDREGGVFTCTWPNGGRPDKPVRYKDEVWTGIEYQVAAGLAAEGLIDESLVLVRAIDDRYQGAMHNPWNEVECGDHYARAMASWGVYQALAGFIYDGPAGRVGIVPRLTPHEFRVLLTGAEGWGVIGQQRRPGEQINSIDVRWGKVQVKEFIGALPDVVDHDDIEIFALLDKKEIPARFSRDEARRVVATFESKITVNEGQTLWIVWRAMNP